jgi:hypothetical protein
VKQLCEGSRQRAEVLDEAPVIPGEAEEAVQCTRRGKLWPRCHDRHLVPIHGHPRR